MMSLAEFLSARRISCAEFARTLGVRDTTVLRWKNGDRNPTVTWAFAIQKATDGLVPASAWLPSERTQVKRAAGKRARRKVRRSRKQTH